jgi:hypothetical protein
LCYPKRFRRLRVLLVMRKDDFEKSIVGDPVFWPGLIYAPLNVSGLIFALGSISNMTGLIFEEFSESGRAAVCRRRTEKGWERIRVALAVKSSEFELETDDIDLLVCWDNDCDDEDLPPVMELSAMGSTGANRPNKGAGDVGRPGQQVSSDSTENDEGNSEYGDFEKTIRLLDEKIRKFKGG